jgi:hypothetical protein
VVYLPLGNTLFDTVSVPWQVWPVILGLTALSFTVVNTLNRLAAERPR